MEAYEEYIIENPEEFRELFEINRNSKRIDKELEERRKEKMELIEKCKRILKER